LKVLFTADEKESCDVEMLPPTLSDMEIVSAPLTGTTAGAT
jgi:hypothetical protein